MFGYTPFRAQLDGLLSEAANSKGTSLATRGFNDSLCVV